MIANPLAVLIVGIVLISNGMALADDPAPADVLANPSTRMVLNLLDELPKRQERRLLVGQFCDWHPRASLSNLNELKKESGHTPALLSLDYFETFLDPDEATQPLTNKPARWQAINPLFIEHWRMGGLVTLSTHMINPWSGRKAWDKQGDLRNLLEADRPGPELRAILDPIADGLADLQSNRVVVMFRPYHELTGSSFWWAGKNPQDFQRLWLATFRYFTREKSLHNLLWVFNPHSVRGETAMQYYPGNSYVDIVSFDLYGTNMAAQAGTYQTLRATGKPFLLAEFGPRNPPELTAEFFAKGTFDYDYSHFPEELLKAYPDVIGFVAWRGPFSLGRNRNGAALLKNPLALDREELARTMRWARGRGLPGAKVPVRVRIE